MTAINVENLNFAYNDESIISSLSFTVDQGDFLAIAGPNGAGKSSLLNLLIGQLEPSNGNISLMNANLSDYNHKELARKIAIVRQEFVPAFGFTVYDTVMMARTPFFNILGFESSRDRKIVDASLEATGVLHLAQRELNHISGGERQRVFIARALAQDTPIILLDEPTSFLDLKHQIGIYDLLKEMQLESGKTIITVTHDLNLAAQYCDKVLLLGYRDKYHIGEPQDLFVEKKISEIFSVEGTSAIIDGKYIFMPEGRLSGKRKAQ